ncbi:helicase [Streptomyces lavendulae]
MKLGGWVCNTETRRHELTQEQLDALRELGMGWA